MCGGEQDNEVRPNPVKEMETLVRTFKNVNIHCKITYFWDDLFKSIQIQNVNKIIFLLRNLDKTH